MQIIICGGGEVGSAICEALYQTADIVIVDPNEHIIDEIAGQYDIQGIVGSAASVRILQEAGIATADVFIAVTNTDEKNIISAIIAQNFGVKHVYGRVRDPEYMEDIQFMQSAIGVNRIVNPEHDAAVVIDQILRYPFANSIEAFANGRMHIVGLTITPESAAANCKIMDFRNYLDSDILICAIERGDEVYIPDGDFVMQAGDRIHILSEQNRLKILYNRLRTKQVTIKKVLIIDGGTLTHYLLEELKQRHLEITVIEQDYKTALQLAISYPEIEVIHGDGSDQRVLEEEHIKNYDAVISLNRSDHENMVTSLFAMHQGVPKVITKLDRPYLLRPLANLGLDTIITPKQLVADKIIQLTRSLKATENSAVNNLYMLIEGQLEALEFEVLNECLITQNTLRDLMLEDQTLIIGILRQDEFIVPTGDTQIKPGDFVYVVTKQHEVTDINQLVVKA